jgi:hypothetical protein
MTSDAPLIRALAAGDAVAFVGSGASIPSGLPSWPKFLGGLLDRELANAASQGASEQDWRRTKELLDDNDFLLAAELLQRGMPRPTFSSYVKEVFGTIKEPNDIHRSIARLPFALALTTNFDVLLENAYQVPVDCYSWQQANAVFNAIREKTFAVVKIHGSANDIVSLRLTRTHYRDATLASPEFSDCLKSLLAWKTLLFIGYSLRDSDLLHLVDESRLKFGENFGPHYAIMPATEVDERFRAYLKDCLGIEVLLYDPARSACPAGQNPQTYEVIRILKDLSGRVAKRRQTMAQGVGFNAFSVSRAKAAQALVKRAVSISGSIRGDVCLVESDERPRLNRVAAFPPERMANELPPIDVDSLISTAYLHAHADVSQDYIYLRDVADAANELSALGYTNAHYQTCDSSVRSELACPILADGHRVGTLNLEADLEEAYTADHVEAAKGIAAELGEVYLRSEHRRKTAVALGEFYQHAERLRAFISNSHLVRELGHDFLVYEIDYDRMKLVAHHPSLHNEEFTYEFDEPALATYVLKQRREALVPDAEKAVCGESNDDLCLNRRGVERFGIRGPIFACPIRPGGQTAAIFVTWLKDFDVKEGIGVGTRFSDFRASLEHVSRLVALLANDISDRGETLAEQFVKGLCDKLRVIDQGCVWRRRHIRQKTFRDSVRDALMDAVVSSEIGLLRVRIWQATGWKQGSTPRQAKQFTCVGSLTHPDATAKGKDPRNAYNGVIASADDEYCRYTTSRFSHDPFAKWHDPLMFNKADSNAAALDKDPQGSWIVAPIVRGDRILGFLSADAHAPGDRGPIERHKASPRETAFQCRALDIVADLARYLLPPLGR